MEQSNGDTFKTNKRLKYEIYDVAKGPLSGKFMESNGCLDYGKKMQHHTGWLFTKPVFFGDEL